VRDRMPPAGGAARSQTQRVSLPGSRLATTRSLGHAMTDDLAAEVHGKPLPHTKPRRPRTGFDIDDHGMSLLGELDQAVDPVHLGSPLPAKVVLRPKEGLLEARAAMEGGLPIVDELGQRVGERDIAE